MDLTDKRDMCFQGEVTIYCVYATKNKTEIEILAKRIGSFF